MIEGLSDNSLKKSVQYKNFIQVYHIISKKELLYLVSFTFFITDKHEKLFVSFLFIWYIILYSM